VEKGNEAKHELIPAPLVPKEEVITGPQQLNG
jgi:hypothetical protein